MSSQPNSNIKVPTLQARDYALWAIVALALIWLIVLLLPVLMPFIAAAIVAYIFEPLVIRLGKIKLGKFSVNRSLSALLILLTLFFITFGLLSLLIPLISKELVPLLDKIPEIPIYLNKFLNKFFPTVNWESIINAEHIKELIGQNKSTIFSIIKNLQNALISSGGSIIGLFINALLFPVALFYFIVAWPQFSKTGRSLLPPQLRGRVMTTLSEIDNVLDEYFHGQFLVMLSLSTFYTTSLLLIGLPNGFSLGVLIGLMCILPYIGFSIGFGLCLFMAILHTDSSLVLWVIGVFSVGQLLESYLLTPYLIGERIGLHPLTVMFALLAFGSLLGFVGVLLALPASAIILVLLRHLNNYYHQSKLYKLS